MNLSELPRIRLATLPTPLQPAERLSDVLGGPIIWFKRDDLTGFGLGGNKVRKLEFLAADALREGADCLVTGAGPQSNHVRTTMAVAAHLGLEGFAVFHGQAPKDAQGNLLLDKIFGANYRFTNDDDRTKLDSEIQAEAEQLRAMGRNPYVIGRGGASPLGCAGYVLASLEILSQLVELKLQPDHLICATGSCGTHAGLLLGKKWLQLTYQITGITVSRSKVECKQRIEKLFLETRELLRINTGISDNDIQVNDAHIGEGYGIPTPACLKAIRLVSQTEGIFLDPVYTGKAMAGLIDLIEKNIFTKDQKILFLHTGGAPSLFAHANAFEGF